MRSNGEWVVRCGDGRDYGVHEWRDGVRFPGTREDAVREARLVRKHVEPGVYAWRSTSRPAWSEPLPCGHSRPVDGCGGCDPAAVAYVIDRGVLRPFDPPAT